MRGTPVIAITAGDPCGIGPEVILKALAHRRALPRAHLVIIGDLGVFQQAATQLRQHLPSWSVVSPGQSWPLRAARPVFIHVAHPYRFMPGRPSAHAGEAALDYLAHAVTLARHGRLQALVTAPVTKWAVQRHHRGFVGHTEYLAGALKVRRVAMMFASDRLRVVLLTRHVPLSSAGRLVNTALVRDTLRLTVETLRRRFGIRRPRIGICGLNPHAGEQGLFGTEERRILPVIQGLNRARRIFDGPMAADSCFANAAHSTPLRAASRAQSRDAARYDAIVCWYHDQGLIPFKMVARDRGCQLTLGLPIVRTSPDHGSALDIAGRGLAHPGSMRYALNLAARLAARLVKPDSC